MKLLLKLLGISDYIEELENDYNNALESISQLHKDKDVLSKELEETYSSLNQLLNTKSTLTAEVLKLREQLEEANKEIKQLEELNEAQTNKIVDIKYTIKNRLLNLLQHDLSISIRPDEYYD